VPGAPGGLLYVRQAVKRPSKTEKSKTDKK
jgi:hypothetical protein